MKNKLKKSGQQIAKKLTRFSIKASAEGKEHVKENLIERIPHAKNVRLLILEWSLLVAVLIMLAVTQSIWYSGSYSANAFVSGGTYTEATLGKVTSLNPLFATTSSEKTLSKLLFATLSATDYSGHTGPSLAKSITSDETGKTWTVVLRDDLKWSDGEPITSEDVVFTAALIKNAKVTTSFAPNLAGVSVTGAGDSTILFSLPSTYVNFTSALDIPILPKHILEGVDPSLLLEHSFSSSPVTSGAFKYKATQVVPATGESVFYLAPNEYYYKGTPMLNSFAVHTYTDTDAIISAIKSGTVTATAELPTTDADKVTSSKIYERTTTISDGVYMFLNTTRGIFRNKNLRKAVQKGVDMDALRELIGDEPNLDYPIAYSQIELNSWPDLPTYDQEAAAATVAAEVPADSVLELVTVSSGYFETLANKLVEELESLGFTVNLSVYEPNQEFIVNVISGRNYDILLYEIELGPDPDLFAYYHSSQATSSGLNLSNYNNTLVDDSILAARGTMNPRLRVSKYETFLRQWVEDAPAIGIYQTNMSYFYNRNVRTFSLDNSLIYATDRFSDIEHWAAEKASRNRTP